MQRVSRVAVTIVFALSSTGVALAGDFWSRGAPSEKASSEQTKKAEEADAAYARFMAKGDELAIEIGKFINAPSGSSFERNRLRKRYRGDIERAIEAYELASNARPDAAEPHFRAAEVIDKHLLERSINTPVMRDRDWATRALEHWRAFERLTPLDPRVIDSYFRRALINTKMADDDGYRRAIENYENLLRRSDLNNLHPENAAVWLGNLAETYMMVGRLEDAIATYERALAFSAYKALSGYGLAVALDRDEQGVRAREVMFKFAEMDALRELMSSDVFFVPRGELEYYLALGHETMGELDKAETHYQAFIDSGAHPRYQARARENLEWVRELKKRRRKVLRSLPVPKGLNL